MQNSIHKDDKELSRDRARTSEPPASVGCRDWRNPLHPSGHRACHDVKASAASCYGWLEGLGSIPLAFNCQAKSSNKSLLSSLHLQLGPWQGAPGRLCSVFLSVC